jgi:hypothetical protein
MLIQYVRKPDGRMDEVMKVTRNLKTLDIQTHQVILDFRKMQVVQASLNGVRVPPDWDRIVGYYHQHYKATIDRMLAENNIVMVKEDPSENKSQNDPS